MYQILNKTSLSLQVIKSQLVSTNWLYFFLAACFFSMSINHVRVVSSVENGNCNSYIRKQTPLLAERKYSESRHSSISRQSPHPFHRTLRLLGRTYAHVQIRLKRVRQLCRKNTKISILNTP